jgi:hypothetical protein
VNRQAERAAAILDRRTRALAERQVRAEATAAAVRRALVVAAVGQSLLGIDIADIAAVIPFEGCAAMPMRDPAVLGVIGRAGRFYSVVGLRRLLSVAVSDDDGSDGSSAHLLLLRGGAPHLALAVDRVIGRFDLAGSGPSFDLDGRLVALFDPETLRRRFGPATPDALS